MTALQLLELLDQLEVRRRRDFDRVRSCLILISGGQEWSISAGAADPLHDGRMSLLMRYEDVADALDLSVPTVRRLVKAGRLPAVEVGGARRVRRCDLEDFIAGLGPGANRMRPLRDLENR